MDKRKGFIVFTDLKGFSDLDEQEQKYYLTVYLGILSDQLKPLLQDTLLHNTWGDAIVAVFEDGKKATDFMLEYRKATKNLRKSFSQTKKVLARIAGHYGEINVFEDPLLERNNTISRVVNTAARIEPITRTGEIFVSKEFKEAFMYQNQGNDEVKFEHLGLIPLSKGHGDHELYRLINRFEPRFSIEKLFRKNLPNLLPNVSEMTIPEKDLVAELKSMTDRNVIHSVLQKEWEVSHTGAFAIEVAEICKKIGFYETGLNWLEMAQAEEYIITDEICLYPYKTARRVIKIRADLLTRLDRYEESADILYGLWKNIDDQNAKDASDILSMLAAQFKRQALMKNQQNLPREEVDNELLERAAGLYLEAFRYNVDDYYPAINAAYLLMILGKETESDGRRLAKYIRDSWDYLEGTSRWLDFTLAQTQLILGFIEEAVDVMDNAFRNHYDDIGIFEIESTKLQILQFLKLMKMEEDGEALIALLDYYMAKKR